MSKQLMDLVEDEEFEMFVLLKSVVVKTTKNNKKYLDVVFEDQSGEISGKYWGASKESIENFATGKVVFLAGKRETYMNSPQIKITSMRLTEGNEPKDPLVFLKQAPMSKSDLEEEINETVFEITNVTYNRIVRYLLQKHGNDFYTFPAAKYNHHAIEGGLAFHTASILKLAHAVVAQYENIDAPLLFAGAILHDLGKTIELSGPISTSYTVAGNLIGHLSLVDGEIVEAANSLKIDENSEDVILLRHIVLSHHGLLEYGSPKRPEVLEADILHQLDELDASINMVQKSLNKTVEGEFGERIFGMDNRRFYKPTANKKD